MGCHHQHKGGAGGVVLIALGVLTGVSGREVSSFRDTIVEKSIERIYTLMVAIMMRQVFYAKRSRGLISCGLVARSGAL